MSMYVWFFSVGTIKGNQNKISNEINSNLNLDNAVYHYVQTVLY